jgi:hypothetical protein
VRAPFHCIRSLHRVVRVWQPERREAIQRQLDRRIISSIAAMQVRIWGTSISWTTSRFSRVRDWGPRYTSLAGCFKRVLRPWRAMHLTILTLFDAV